MSEAAVVWAARQTATAREVQGCQGAGGRNEDCRCLHLHRRTGRRCPDVRCPCVERHAIVHRQFVHRDQGDLGGFAVVDVADEEAAQLCAGKIAAACG
jgi:hypothetical protein